MLSSSEESIQNDEARPILNGNKVDRPSYSSGSVEEDAAEKRKCIKNLVLHCISVVFIFSAFLSLQNLESSLNHEWGLGVISMACLYIGLVSACLFSPIIVKQTGYKWAMFACFCAQCLFSATNFYPRFYTLGPACFLLGLTIGPFWTAQGMFITTLAVKYGGYADINPSIVINRFNGMFYMFWQSSQIWGNLISSQIFTSPDDVIWNVSYRINETCGAAFCHFPNNTAFPLVDAPGRKEFYTLLGVYLGCCVVGTMIKGILVDDIKPLSIEEDVHLTLRDTLTSTLRIHCNGCMGLLIPLIFYNGLEQVFLFSDFTQVSAPYNTFDYNDTFFKL